MDTIVQVLWTLLPETVQRFEATQVRSHRAVPPSNWHCRYHLKSYAAVNAFKVPLRVLPHQPGGTCSTHLDDTLPSWLDGKGHVAVIDRFYNSPGVAIYAKIVRQIDIIGTVLKNRRG